MTVINSNISALLSQNANRMASNSLQTAMTALSTGQRINSAADDAAGYSIAAKMTANEKGMAVAIRNANDGISLAQTASSALDSITSALQRIQELATQSANGTLSNADRAGLQTENDQLVAQINDIAKTTNFNGINLLDGTLKSLKLQTGTGASDQISIAVAGASASALGLTGKVASGDLTTGRVGAVTFTNKDDILINGAAAFTASKTTAAGTAAKDLADAINANSLNTGVTASAYNTVTSQLVAPGGTSDTDLKINGQAIAGAKDATQLVANINRDAQGVNATLNEDGTITLSNDTGNAIKIEDGGSGKLSNSGFTASTGSGFEGYVALTSSSGSPISITRNTAGTAAELTALGVNTGTGSNVTGTALGVGALDTTDDAKINGVTVGASKDSSAASKAAAINALTSQTGVTATAKTSVVVALDATKTKATNTLVINGTKVTLTDTDGDSQISMADVVSNINGATNTTVANANSGAGNNGVQGVVASMDANGNLVLTSDSGLDITVADSSTTPSLLSVKSTDGTAADTGGAVATGFTVHGQLTLSSADNSDIRIEGSTGSLGKLGLNTQGGDKNQGTGPLDISTQSAATAALTTISKALDQVTKQAGDLGALQNRLNVTVDNLTSSSTNLEASRSRIQDADFSTETTALAKAQILSQASTAMLAQANQSQQGVLKLLQ